MPQTAPRSQQEKSLIDLMISSVAARIGSFFMSSDSLEASAAELALFLYEEYRRYRERKLPKAFLQSIIVDGDEE
jgi:hypothetical protein